MRNYNIIILCFCSMLLWGQDSTYYQYNRYIKEAEKLSEASEYKKAIHKYDEAFQFINFVSFNYFDAFQTAIKDSDYVKASNYLISGTLKGLDLSEFYTKEIDLFNESQYGQTFWSIKDSLTEIQFNSIDTSFYKALVLMLKLDQAARNRNNVNYYENMYKVDSLNFENLLTLSIEKGFPTFEKVGIGSNKAYLLLWHHRDEYPYTEQWQKIIPLIDHEINLGKLDPEFFRPFKDYKSKNY